MIEGMKRGLYYNQEGKEVLGNEPRLTLDDLNRYLRDFDNTGNENDFIEFIKQNY
jgi:hypothetical protein